MSNNLTPGQDYAIKFLTSKGFKLTSSPVQLKRGNLIFDDSIGNKWGIFKNGGYVRKQTPRADRWGVVYRQSDAAGSQLQDDEYMDLAEIIATKYNADNKKQQKEKDILGEKYYKKVYFWEVYKYRDGFRVKNMNCHVPFSKIKKALDIIVKEKYKEYLSVRQLYDYKTVDAIEVYGHNKDHKQSRKLRIIFFNDSNEIGYTSVVKQYGGTHVLGGNMEYYVPEVISL